MTPNQAVVFLASMAGGLALAMLFLSWSVQWLMERIRKAESQIKDLERDLCNERQANESWQKKYAEQAIRLDEARRAAKGGES